MPVTDCAPADERQRKLRCGASWRRQRNHSRRWWWKHCACTGHETDSAFTHRWGWCASGLCVIAVMMCRCVCLLHIKVVQKSCQFLRAVMHMTRWIRICPLRSHIWKDITQQIITVPDGDMRAVQSQRGNNMRAITHIQYHTPFIYDDEDE